MRNWRLNSIYRFNYLLFVISLSFVTLAGCGQNPDSKPHAYQAAHHLAVTGKADKPTLAEMKL
jgi:hypothetical protein